jgi:hypothetical protein
MTGIYSVITIGLFSAIGYLATIFVGSLATVEPVRMQLEFLRFEDGHFYQHVSVSGAKVINGRWSARIWRPREDGSAIPLCAGSGGFPYEGAISLPMTPDYWTGSDCPEILPGDAALAAWEYTDEKGLQRRLSGTLLIE